MRPSSMTTSRRPWFIWSEAVLNFADEFFWWILLMNSSEYSLKVIWTSSNRMLLNWETTFVELLSASTSAVWPNQLLMRHDLCQSLITSGCLCKWHAKHFGKTYTQNFDHKILLDEPAKRRPSLENESPKDANLVKHFRSNRSNQIDHNLIALESALLQTKKERICLLYKQIIFW